MILVSFRKYNSKIVLFTVVIVVLVLSYIVFKPFSKKSTSTTEKPTSSQNQPTPSKNDPQVVSTSNVQTADFEYQKPSGWAALSQDKLNTQGAVSGIEHISELPATFTVAIEAEGSSPSDDAGVKASVLDSLKKLSNFELVSSVTTSVNGQSGQKFTYKFSDKSTTKQELTVVLFKKKAFSLLFSGPDTDFDKQAAEFTKILSGFKFK